MKQKLAIACGLLHEPRRHAVRRAAHRPRSARHPAHEGTIVERTDRGAAIVVSSHLLHLVEEIAPAIVIIDRGEGRAGTMAEIRAARPAGAGASLEQIFLTVTARQD